MQLVTKKKGNVFAGDAIWQAIAAEIKKFTNTPIFILTDTNTKAQCLPIVLTKLPQLQNTTVLEIPAGEAHKTITSCVGLWDQLSINKADRQSLLINLGGGVVTDLGGFVAATYMRGIQWINIPTSLLAMVDAAVGGKNGVDLGALKNHVGVIAPPLCVGIFLSFLKTLPKNELVSGYAEMLKHGLIYSEKYWKEVQHFDFDTVENNTTLIYESIKIKNEIVTKDPFEKNERKFLNYGHTLGHAIESYFLVQPEVKPLLHGEAIAIGLVLETYLSCKQLNFPAHTTLEVKQIISRYFNKVTFSKIAIERIIDLLAHDKKNKAGQVNFVLLEDVGRPKINQQVTTKLIYEAFAYYASL